MKAWLRYAFWLVPLAATIFVCHVSSRLYQFSTYLMAFSDEPTALSYSELFRYAAYLETPGYSFDACINKLRQIDGAKQQWALEHGIAWTANGTNEMTWSTNVSPTWQDIEPYIKHGQSGRVWCPYGGTYIIGKLSEPPRCSVKGHALP